MSSQHLLWGGTGLCFILFPITLLEIPDSKELLIDYVISRGDPRSETSRDLVLESGTY